MGTTDLPTPKNVTEEAVKLDITSSATTARHNLTACSHQRSSRQHDNMTYN